MRHVDIGDVGGQPPSHTRCSACSELLVERANHVESGAPLAGRW